LPVSADEGVSPDFSEVSLVVFSPLMVAYSMHPTSNAFSLFGS
jgi:hypothetical protein